MQASNLLKHISCQQCTRSICSDNLKRYAGSHKDLPTMSEEEVVKELRALQTAQILREEREQKIEEIAPRENLPLK